jgi:Uma2 family endonuclease
MSAVLTAPAPTARKITPEDFLLLPGQGKGFELVDGELKELNVSTLSSYVGGEMYGHLRDHVRPGRLGWLFNEGASYRCFPRHPGKVRRADVSFHTLDRLTPEQVAAEGHMSVVPDLVVEVISPNDLAYEVNEKRIEWQRAGAKLVWVIDPVQQTIHVYRADGSVSVLNRNDTLTGEPILPEFRVPLADLFRLPAGELPAP